MKKRQRRILPTLLTLTLLAGMLAGLSINAAAAVSWEGSGTPEEPYLISDAEGLRALSDSVNAGSAYVDTWFRLTADLEVRDWIPIGISSSKTFSGIFDGDGYTVTIDNIGESSKTINNIGLFGTVYGGVVMNLTVDGEIIKAYDNGSSYTAGGIVGCLGSNGATQPGRIINCVNRAEISVTTSYEYPYTYAGGIVGQVNGGYSGVFNCYNAGEVTSSRSTGGIVGYGNGGTYGYCYSAVVPDEGKTGYVGGFSGGKCYGTVLECYALDSWSGVPDAEEWVSAANAQGIAAGSQTISGADFWQLSESGEPEAKVCAHTPEGEGIIVAPTCTDRGYTLYTCSACGREYRGDFTDPTGHNYRTVIQEPTCTVDGAEQKICQNPGCTSTVTTVLPATGHSFTKLIEKTDSYWSYECASCGITHRVSREARHGAMELVGVSAELDDSGSAYPWAYSAETGEIYSTNQKKSSSTSQLRIIFRAQADFTLSFDYTVCTQAEYDRLSITLDGKKLASSVSSSEDGVRDDYSLDAVTLSAGEHTLTVEYKKDGYISSGEDTCYVYGLRAKVVCEHSWVEGDTVEATCTENGYTPYVCSLCGDIRKENVVPSLGHDDEINVTAATCTRDGAEVHTCRRCERVEKITLPALGHSQGMLVGETDEAWTYVCTVCHESYEVSKAWDGTYTEPEKDADGAYLVGTASELAWINRQATRTDSAAASAFATANVKLTADVYMKGYDWIPICFSESSKTYYFDGVPYYSGGQYKGTFDGQGHTIYGLEINWDKQASVAFRIDSLGLFGYLGKATIRDLGVVETIRLSNQDTYNYNDNWLNVGAIAGFVQSGSKITGCYADVDFDIRLDRTCDALLNPAVGGIVGALSLNSHIEDCYSTGKIYGEGSGYITMGGIAGSTRTGDAMVITRCWSDVSLTAQTGVTGSSTSTSYIGGIIGTVDAVKSGTLPEVSYCFALNPVLDGCGGSDIKAGRVVGYGERFGNEGSYNFALESMELKNVTPTAYDETDSGYRSGWGRDLTKADALDGETYTNVLWNFDEETEEEQNVWSFSGSGYPTLAWQDKAEPGEGHSVTVRNAANASVGLKEGRYEGKIRFSVSCARACAVLYTTDGGESFTALEAKPAEDGSYTFELDVGADTQVLIALRGDLNLDGVVNSGDAAMAKRFAALLETPTQMQKLVAGTDKITGITALRLLRAAAELYELDW